VGKARGVPQAARVFVLYDQSLQQGVLNKAFMLTVIQGATTDVNVGPVAADITADGQWIAVKNYTEGFLWHRSPSQGIKAVFDATPIAPCTFTPDAAESLAFDYGGGRWNSLLSIRETDGGYPALHRLARG